MPMIRSMKASGVARMSFAMRSAQMWNVQTGELIGPPMFHESWVYHASVSPDGRLVVSCSFDHNACLWDATSGQKLRTMTHPAPVRSAHFSRDGRLLVFACWDYTVRVCSVADGEAVGPPLKHSGNVIYAAFHPTENWILTASEDRTGQIWAVPSGQRLGPSLRHPWRSVVAARFVADGWEILTRRTSGETCLTPLPRDTRSVQDLTLLAQFLSGYQSLPSGTTHPLTKDLLHRRWEQLRTMEDFQKQ
jgi:WD40 repeat protein